ncbi:MAG: response regulator [Saprospiraceae bacterium]|nr:response regulator [Saprospiraceae bacterium]
MPRIFLSLCFVLSVPAYVLLGQGQRFENISLEQGLSSPKIHHLFQDRQGFLWISTSDGLNRYDGHQFKVFRSMPDDPNSLEGNDIGATCEDLDGTLWIGSHHGVHQYDRTTEKMDSYLSKPNVPGKFAGRGVMSMLVDPQGQVWLSTYSTGLHRFDPRRKWFEPFRIDTSWLDYRNTTYASSICLSHDKQHLWVAMELPVKAKLFKINTRTNSVQAYPIEGLIDHSHCWTVLEDRQGNVWVGTTMGLWKLNPALGVCQRITATQGFDEALCRGNISSLLEDAAGTLWITTLGDGLFAYHPQQQRSEHYRHDSGDPGSLPGNRLFGLLQDRSGVLWAGSTDKGLSKLVPDKVKFQSIRDEKSIPPNTNIITVYESRNDITWLGTPTGLLAWNRKTGALRRIRELVPQFPELENYTYSTIEDPAGNLWVGTNSFGLLRLSPNWDACTWYKNDPAKPGSLINDYIRSLSVDRSGTLWLGTYLGLDRYDPATDRFIHYQHDPKQPNSLPSNYINSIQEDAAGRLWLGTASGACWMDRVSGRCERFICADPNPEYPSCTMVHHLLPSQNGMWAGTTTGLYQFSPPAPGQTDWTTRHYTQKDGLPHNEIFSLLDDHWGQLWLGTRYGLSVFKNPGHAPQTRPDFQNYDTQSGLLSLEFMEGACAKNKQGELLFGGPLGLNYFHPDSLRHNPHPPAVVIVGFEKLDANHPEAAYLPEKGIADRDQVVISYQSNVFTIEFAALDFREPEKNRFAYRMLGFNDQWIQLGTQHQVTFTNLDPGEYTFQVRGANNDGIWNETPRSLRIIITPPWWKTTWAYIAYALLFVAAISGFVQARLRFLKNRTRMLETAVRQGTAQIQEQKELLEVQAGELQELDRLKSRFYANITHELRTPLTLILGPLSSVLKNRQLPHKDLNLLNMAQENGQKLLKLIREILDLGKLDAGKLQLVENAVLIRPLSTRLVTQFDSYAQYLGVQLRLHLEDIPPDLCVLLDEQKFETIVNNLISNALKFTPPGGHVDVALTDQGQEFLLQIKDSGRGIHPDDLPHIFDRYFQTKQTDTPIEGGTGIGLALCAELARLLGGRIWAESTVGAGTTLSLAWPRRIAAVPATPISLANAGQSLPPGQSNALPTTPELPSHAEATGTNPPPRILVVEDNPDLQQYLDFLLSPLYEVVKAGNGEEALALLDGVQLILSDIMMPRMDGFALLEHLKGDDRYRHIPVILLTARADKEDRLRALRTGVDDYLTKPFEAEELLARVENLLQHQQNRLPKEDEVALPVLSKVDADWLVSLETWIRSKIADEFLTVTALAQEAALSERQLQRRLRETTGLSPQQYIAELRLQAAREGLERGAYRTVAEVAYAVGFGHAKAFSRAYRTRFGRLPSTYF